MPVHHLLCILGHGARVQPVEGRIGRQEGVRIVELDEFAGLQHDDFVEVQDGVELVRHSEDRVAGESLADDALHDFVGLAVDAVFIERNKNPARCLKEREKRKGEVRELTCW